MTNQPTQSPPPLPTSSSFGSSTHPASPPQNTPSSSLSEGNRFIGFFRGRHLSINHTLTLKPKYIFAMLSIVLVLIAAGVGLLLVQNSQDIRQQASGGYAGCTGGIKNGQRTCSGFREVAECHNGALIPITTCSADQKCTNGVCGNDTTTSSSPSPSLGMCSYQGVAYQQGQCIAYSGLRCNASGYGDLDSQCPSTPPPSPSPIVACSSMVIFPTAMSNSSPCIFDGEQWYQCNSGYINSSYTCVPRASVNLSSCRSGSGLFVSPVSNSSACIFNGEQWYQCNSGYINSNNTCISAATPEPSPLPSSSGCSFKGLIYPSGQCVGTTGQRCVNGTPSQDFGCPQPSPVIASTAPQVSPHPSPSMCSYQGATYQPGQCSAYSGLRCNASGYGDLDSQCPSAPPTSPHPSPSMCSYQGATYQPGQCIAYSGLRCNSSGFGDVDASCLSHPPSSPQPSPMLISCGAYPSGQCMGTTGQRCNNGFPTQDATCPQPSSAQAFLQVVSDVIQSSIQGFLDLFH